MAKQEKKATLTKRTREQPLRTAQPRRARRRELALVAALASAALAVLVTFDLFTEGAGYGRVQPGDIAERSYKAPDDLTLVDAAATEENRRLAVEQAPVVYDFDERWGQTLSERVVAAFGAARGAARAEEGEEPPDPATVLAQNLELAGEPPAAALELLLERGLSSDDERSLLRVLRPVLVRRIVDDPASSAAWSSDGP